MAPTIAFAQVAPSPGWSSPIPIPGIQFGSTLKWPSAAQFHGTVYLTGNVLPTRMSPSVSHPIQILRLPGTPLSPPAGDFVFAFPRGLVDARGAYHLVWAEPSRRGAAVWKYGATAVALWHAAFANGRWTQPQEIVHARSVSWSSDNGSAQIDDKGRIHIAVTVVGDSGGTILRYVRLDSGDVLRRDFPWTAAYGTVSVKGRDSVLLAVVGVDPKTRRGSNALFVVWSSTGGRNWSEPTVVADAKWGRVLSQPLVIPSHQGINLIAAAQADPTSRRTVLSRWRLGIDGWTASQASLPEGELIRMTGASACDAPFVVTEMLVANGSSIRPTLVALYWPTTAAAQTEELFAADRAATGAEILPIEGGIRLFASVVDSTSVLRLVSTSHAICHPPSAGRPARRSR